VTGPVADPRATPDPAATDWVPVWNLAGGIGGVPATQPSVRVYRSTQQSIPTSVWTPIAFDKVRYDAGPSPHWSASQPTRLTCQMAGTYVIWGSIQFVPQAGGTSRAVAVMLNGTKWSAVGGLRGATVTGGSGDYPMAGTPQLIQLVVGDYVELNAWQESGVAINTNASDADVSRHAVEFALALVGGMVGPQGPQGPAGSGSGLVTGDLVWNVGATRAGAVPCNGALLDSVADTSLAALYALIGTSYGGTGASSFAVPDVQGRMLVCKGTNADVNAAGKNDGQALANRSPLHGHSASFAGAGGNTGYVSADHAHYTSGQTGGRSAQHTHGSGVLQTRGGNWGSTAYGNVDPMNTTGEGEEHTHSFAGWSGGISANHTHAFTPSGTVAVGPGGSRPVDMVPFIVENCFIVK